MDRIILGESDLKRLIRKSLGKNLIESHSSELPTNVSQFIDENPKLIIKKLIESYGEKFFDYVGQTVSESRKAGKNIL
jgi:hypothetical protein